MDPYKGEILSIGLVKLNGKELYLELEYDGPVSKWVKENIVPTLMDKKISRISAIKEIENFVGKKKPYAISYVYSFDNVYLHKLFKSEKIEGLPFYWLPIDFASILFGMGINPEAYLADDKDNFLKTVGVDTTKFKHTHNALDDAKLLREVYLKMI